MAKIWLREGEVVRLSEELEHEVKHYVILCYLTDDEGVILGPYAEIEADDVAATLRCRYEIRILTREIPEWVHLAP